MKQDTSSDFQATASYRREQLRRIQSIVDLVQRDILETSFENPGEEEGKNDVCWSLWPGWPQPPRSSSSILPVNDGNSFLRKLSRGEREVLKNVCGCSCANNDWSKIYVLLPTATKRAGATACTNRNVDTSLDLKSLVSNTHFDGFVVLDLTTKIDDEDGSMGETNTATSEWSHLPPGLHSNACVSESIVALRSCRVYRNLFVSRTFVGSETVLANNGHVSASVGGEDGFGTIAITVGAESGGGRSLLLTAESTMHDVARQLGSADHHQEPRDPSSASSPFAFNVVSHGSMIRDTPTVRNVFLHPFSSIESACSVVDSTLFGHSKIGNASVASNVLMQWNATITDNSRISNVLMMEHSHCGPSSILESTIMGPDSHASAGEIHASVFGPNTNAHHQSLLVGVLWPMGRGNVAYGANVGSNHTGRLPDQECTAGEGIFWGLSCVVKLPVDLSQAPYSIVAAGTTLPPQRITMPFSLVVESSTFSSSSRSRNDIVPGWVLQHSPYTLVRNDKKYATRRKATRHADYTGWKILRPDTVERCRHARKLLRKTQLPTDHEHYIPLQSVSGVGACALTERARDGGIKAYDNCIQLYALEGLLAWCSNAFGGDSEPILSMIDRIRQEFRTPSSAGRPTEDFSATRVEWPPFPWDANGCEETRAWEYQRNLLADEFPIPCDGTRDDNSDVDELLSWIGNLLNKLVELEKDFAERVAKSKRRDDKRGASIIPGYSEFHVSAESDPVIVGVREKAFATEQLVQKLTTDLERSAGRFHNSRIQ